MSFLQRTGCRFAASAVMVACFAASSAFAAMLATNDFETSFADFTTDETLASLATYNGDGPSGSAAYPFGSFGSKYLAVDSDTNTLWRSFDARSANTYFDSYVQFTPMFGDFEYPADAKFLIFLDSETNLCVISGTSANDRTAVTNTLVTSPAITPNSWGRLTVRALSSGSVFSFQVLLNGDLLSTSGSVNTFYSLTAGTTMSEVGFSGTGALDNFAVRTTDPLLAAGDTKATIDGENYASLELALDESDGATVTLAANQAAVGVSTPGTYVVDAGSYAFGGIVGLGGATVAASTSGSVMTYTVSYDGVVPVAVWDGNSPSYDFSTLMRGTYTLNLNTANTVAGDGSYAQIGNNDQKAAITITSGTSGAFGTSGKVTVIMKCSSLNLSDNTYRGLIGFLADEGGYYSGDNNVKVGVTTGNNIATAGANTYYFANGVYYSSSANTTAYTTGSQSICVAYDSASGTYVYRDGSLIASSTGVKYGTWLTPVGIVLGGMDLDGSSRVYAQTGMKIEAVAVFANCLTADEVAAYKFPSEAVEITDNITVSEINALTSGSDISLNVADGVTITGDTTFNASTVHFASAGEVVVCPSNGDTATLDFSGVAKPVIEYTAMPTISGSVFTSTTVPTWVTDATKWTGVISLNGVAFTDFTSNAYGNEMSVVRLQNASGWFKTGSTTPHTNSVPVELVGTLSINNGNSADGSHKSRCSVFKKLSGNGTINTTSTGSGTVVVIQDASEFTGGLGLNSGKYIVFGEAMPDYDTVLKDTTVGTIFVMAGVTMTNSNFWWATGGIQVYGELRAPNHKDYFGGGTTITTSDTGVFTLTSTGNGSEAETDADYARITGTGTLKYEGSGWRALSTNNFPTAMTLENEQADDILLSRALTYTIGSLSGSKNFQGNYGDGKRYLHILQAKDTEWSGLNNPDGYSRLAGFVVSPGASTAGTLTLSGTQTQSTALTVESGAKVNLTGTWVGPVTVDGTLGGTGTVSGGLTLSDGAVIKVDDRTDTVSVNNLTVNGTVSVYLPASAVAGDTFLSTSAMPTFGNAAFKIYVGETLDASLRVIATSNGLKIAPKVKGAKFFFH